MLCFLAVKRLVDISREEVPPIVMAGDEYSRAFWFYNRGGRGVQCFVEKQGLSNILHFIISTYSTLLDQNRAGSISFGIFSIHSCLFSCISLSQVFSLKYYLASYLGRKNFDKKKRIFLR